MAAANSSENRSGRWGSLRALLRAVWRETWEDNCVDLAAQTSFYFVLAIFPFFIVLAALVSYFPATPQWHAVVDWIADYLPSNSRHLVVQTILGLTEGRSSFLTFGVATSAWAASTGIVGLMEAMNIVYEVREDRPYWKKRALALGMLVVFCVFFLTAFALLTFGEGYAMRAAARIFPGLNFIASWKIGRWAISIVLLVVGMAFVEYFLPNARLPWKWVTLGALFVVGASVPASLGFRYYMQHYTIYDATYGTLGAFFVLMLSVSMESLIVLVGGEVNSELEKLRSSKLRSPHPTPGEAGSHPDGCISSTGY